MRCALPGGKHPSVVASVARPSRGACPPSPPRNAQAAVSAGPLGVAFPASRAGFVAARCFRGTGAAAIERRSTCAPLPPPGCPGPPRPAGEQQPRWTTALEEGLPWGPRGQAPQPGREPRPPRRSRRQGRRAPDRPPSRGQIARSRQHRPPVSACPFVSGLRPLFALSDIATLTRIVHLGSSPHPAAPRAGGSAPLCACPVQTRLATSSTCNGFCAQQGRAAASGLCRAPPGVGGASWLAAVAAECCLLCIYLQVLRGDGPKEGGRRTPRSRARNLHPWPQAPPWTPMPRFWRRLRQMPQAGKAGTSFLCSSLIRRSPLRELPKGPCYATTAPSRRRPGQGAGLGAVGRAAGFTHAPAPERDSIALAVPRRLPIAIARECGEAVEATGGTELLKGKVRLARAAAQGLAGSRSAAWRRVLCRESCLRPPPHRCWPTSSTSRRRARAAPSRQQWCGWAAAWFQ